MTSVIDESQTQTNIHTLHALVCKLANLNHFVPRLFVWQREENN